MISPEDALIYEIHSSWFAGYAKWEWLRTILGLYYAWKVHRKHGRYRKSMAIRSRLIVRDLMRGVRS